MRRYLTWRLVVLLAPAVIIGCGSGSSDDAGSKANKPAAKTAKAQQAKLFKGDGYKSPPTTSPPPQKGKTVWIFSCEQSVASCVTPTNAAVEAAKKMGWDTTLYDAKFDPGRLAEGFRQAIAAKVDGVILYALDCPLAKGAASDARKAGLKIVAGESLNCDPPLYDYVDEYTQGPFPEWESQLGSAQATNLIAGTNGSPKVIALNQTDSPALIPVVSGFKHRMEACGSSCEITKWIDFTTPDFGNSLQQKLQQALLQHPEANAVWLPYDIFSLGPDAALRASGRGDAVLTAVGEGQASTMDVLRSGRINGVGVGIPQDWEGYHSVDSLNRLFAGEKPQPSGIGLQSYDKTRNTPSDGRWEPPFDYRPVYLNAWGVGE